MKKLLSILAGMAAIAFASCAGDNVGGVPGSPKNEGFKLSLSVESHGSELQTRTSIAPEPGEDVVQSLYLLFFDVEDNGTGQFLNYYRATGPFTMNQDISVNFSDGGLGDMGDQTLNNHTAYNIFAIANLEDGLYFTGTVADWLNSFIGMNEAQVMDRALLALTGVSSSSDYTTRMIESDMIPMSSSFSKGAAQEHISTELIRAVARFDVHNKAREQWDLVSASVWNAYPTTTAWKNGNSDFNTPRLKRFYGIESAEGGNGNDGYPVRSDIMGKLYSFSNFVSSPEDRDQRTTCIIVGMARRDGNGNTGAVTYHRANINPADASQFLKRNNVYKLTVNSVIGEGAPDEESAYNRNGNTIDYVVNNWDLDDNGMVLIDGTNTLVVPVKKIKLNPEGETREYSIFTMGPGTLVMSSVQLDNGLSAYLVGNRLTIEATPMANNEDERRGTVVLTLGSLDATIDIIQTRNEAVFLELNKTNIVEFPAYGSGMIMLGGDVIVNASGSWTAKIFNTSSEVGNFGFSFDQSQLNPPKTTLASAEAYDNHIKIFTTGDNPENNTRYAFVIVTLDGHDDINRSLVLAQRPATGIKVKPEDQTDIVFNPLGVATTNTTFTVEPGIDDSQPANNQSNAWGVEIVGEGSARFSIESLVCNTDEAQTQTFTVNSAGLNDTGTQLRPRVRVYLISSPDTQAYLNIRQERADWSVPSSYADISEDGGTTVNIALNAPAGLHYEVSIQSLTPSTLEDHFAYMVESDDAAATMYSSLTARDVSRMFKVGFPKLIYPNTGVQPQVTIAVKLVETGETKTFTVRQSQLTQNPIRIENVGNDWGRLLNSGGNWNPSYNRYFVDYLSNSSYFGPSGTVRTNGAVNATNSTGSTVSTATRYIHYSRPVYGGSGTDRDNVIYNWINSNDGVLVMFVDEDSRNATGSFTSSYLPGKLGFVATSYQPNTRTYNLNPSGGKILNYLVKDGPWAQGSELSGWATTNYNTAGVTSGVTVASLNTFMTNAVPILLDNTDGTVLVIDPEYNVVYSGDSEIFYTPENSTTGYNSTMSTTRGKILGNLLAYIVNAAQYGNNFTDYFWDSPRILMTAPDPQQ